MIRHRYGPRLQGSKRDANSDQLYYFKSILQHAKSCNLTEKSKKENLIKRREKTEEFSSQSNDQLPGYQGTNCEDLSQLFDMSLKQFFKRYVIQCFSFWFRDRDALPNY